MAHAVEKYGVHAVFGRPLFLHEMQEINIAEKIYNGYMSRKGADSLAKWTTEHQDTAEILSGLEKEHAQH